MCGDSTNLADVESAVGGGKPVLVLTDPPYGVKFERGKYQGNNHGAKFAAIANDSLEGQALEEFLRASFANAYAVTPEEAAMYAWTGCSPKLADGGATTLHALNAAGWEVQSQIVWAKTPFVLGRADYHWQHEAAWYGFKPSGHPWHGGRDKGSVWNVPKPRAMDLHPTMKPVELMEIAIGNSTLAGNAVLDLFLGSGSTLIACEKTARSCYGTELSPQYVDVIVKRWQTFTGKEATLEATGATFPALSRSRAKAA